MVDRPFYEKSPALMAQLVDSQDQYLGYGGGLLDDGNIHVREQYEPLGCYNIFPIRIPLTYLENNQGDFPLYAAF